MTQLKNAKVLLKDGKLLLIDAPEKANFIDFKNVDNEGRKRYDEALSKAPTWKIKNGREVKRLIFESLPWKGAYEFSIVNWQPEQGKLYELPKGYEAKINLNCVYCFNGQSKCSCDDSHLKEFAILIPQEEVKPIPELPKETMERIEKEADKYRGEYDGQIGELIQDAYHDGAYSEALRSLSEIEKLKEEINSARYSEVYWKSKTKELESQNKELMGDYGILKITYESTKEILAQANSYIEELEKRLPKSLPNKEA